MMNTLIESKEVSEQILIKIVGQLTTKYELREKLQVNTLVQDFNKAIQQLLLYNHTIQQLFSDSSMLQGRILSTYHRQIYKLVEFLVFFVQKVSNKAKIQRNSNDLPSSFCSNCQHYIHHQNIKNMQAEILDFHKYSIQRFDQQLRIEFEENQNQSEEEEKIILSEEYFKKKMEVIQKSMNERQINLLQCIDDFESLKTKLLSQAKKSNTEKDVREFNIKQFITEISEGLLSNFRKIQERILRYRKISGSIQDQASQTIVESEKLPNTQRNQLNKQNIKLESQVKKLSQSKVRLEQLCKKYQTQLRDSSARVEVLQNQNKKIREEIFSEKIKASHRQKLLKNAETTQQKVTKQKQEDGKFQKQSILAHFQSLLSQTGDFAAQFSDNIKQHLNNKQLTNRQDKLAPLIKSAFKKTLDRYTRQESLIVVTTQKKKVVRTDSLPESPHTKRKSKEKVLKMQHQFEGRHQNSRFSMMKMKPNFTISNIFNYKICGNFRSQKSLFSQIQQTNKSIQKQGRNDEHKRKRLAKLSIFSDIRQQSEQHFPKRDFQKRRQSTEFNLAQVSYNLQPNNTLNSKSFQKSALKRTKSQQDLQSLGKIEDAFKIYKPKRQMINTIAVQKFFFISPDQNTEHFREQNTQLSTLASKNRSKYISNGMQRGAKTQRQKVILNLQELSYLTALFSLLAKVHLINPNQYAHFKGYILSAARRQTIKVQQDGQNLIIRKTLSEIIYKHRQCKTSKSLCPHLNDFLNSIQANVSEPPKKGQQSNKT